MLVPFYLVLQQAKRTQLNRSFSSSYNNRVVIQAGPPFLLVHTNAAYTRLTGIDAHAAVGKPVSALLSLLGPGNTLSSSAINADLEGNEGDVNQISSSSNGAGNSNGAVSLNEVTSQDQTNSYLEGRTAPPRQRMEGWNMESSGANQPNGQTYAQAAAAGVARAAQASQNESADVRLERLIATAGFGKYHRLHATCRPHHMVGRNVSFVNRAGGSGASIPLPGMQNDYGSSDMSLTSKYEGPFDMVACRASISPILSDYIETGVVTDTNNQDFHEHNNKRRKHHHTGHDQQKPGAVPNIGHHHRRSFVNKVDSAALKRYHQHLTHYAIQLEIFDDRKELNRDLLSSSSTSVEANILGLTKGEYRRQREVAQGGTGANTATSREGSEARQHLDEDDDMASETTEATAPVTAVG